MYYAKMQKAILTNPQVCGLDWIQTRDEAERQVWIEEHRSSTKSLGVIIVQVMARRDSMWESPLKTRSLSRRTSEPGSTATGSGGAGTSPPKKELNSSDLSEVAVLI